MKCKKRQSIRASAVILLAGILLSLASCTRAAAPGGETPSGEPSAPTVPIEHAYRETALPVNIKGAAMLAYSGGRIYFDRQDAPGGPSVVSASLDGSEETVVWSREAEEPYSEMMGYSLTCFTADGEGNLFTVSRYVYPDDNDPNMPAYRDELTKTSPDGTELYSVDLTTLLDGAPVEVFGIAADGAGNAYLLGGGGMSIYALDGAAGALKFTVSENSPVMNITHSGDGSVIYAAMGFDPGASDMTYSMKTIDYAAGTASEMPPNAGDTFTDFSGIFAGAGDNAFFARFANKIYGFKSGDMTAEVIVDLLNSDIDPAYIGRVFAAENGEFLAARLDGSEMITSLSRLTPDPDAVLGDKALLQLATLWLDPVTRGAVLDFNRTSKTARIEVLDFDRDLTRFDLALIGQSPADLYSFNGGYGLDAVKYVSKGVFADLYPLLDADETLSRGDMFQNVLDAASIGGSLYYATPFFTVNTLAGKESVFGDVSAITPEELENVADKYPDASIYEIMAAAPVQQAWVPLVLSNMSRYVNLETGEVNFDGPEFIAQLRLSERMPLGLDFASLDIMEFMNDYPARRANGEVLLEAVAISGPRAARTLETELFGEPVALVGVPTYGENGGRISPHTVYTVSSVTEHPEEAWSFIASMLSEDFEPRFENSYYVAGRVVRDEKLTLNKNIFERRVAEEMTPLAERDISNGMLVSEFSMARLASWPVFSLDELDMTLPKYQSYALTETDAARVREAIEGATVLTAHDTALMNIALEELGAFYAGVKTAEETARLIQSRAALYVAEQG